MPPAWASGGQRPLAAASVRAGHGLYGRYSDALVVHGKEKVYGSSPSGGSTLRTFFEHETEDFLRVSGI